jgi:hypothetical protein
MDQLLSSGSCSTNEKQYVERLLASIYYPGILERYPDSLFPFQDKSPKIFLAPKPVCDAHISAKAIAEVYRDDFMELLVKEARIYWLSRARKNEKKS